MSPRQSKVSKERLAFCAFAKAAVLDLDEQNIREPSPPQPDILATIENEVVAYELTEGVEPEYRRKLSLMLKTPDILRSEFAKLSATEQGALLSRHNGKLIDVCFRDNTHSLRDRQSAASEVMVFLSSLSREIGVDSDTRLNDPAALPSRLLDHISISAIPEMDGIYWDASAPASWIDTESAIRDRLHDKMTQKFYKTEHPIELVLYLHSQVAPPANTGWIEALSAEAAARLPSSPFRCVWFYDGWSGNVYVLASRDRG